jgi:prolyl-tRNA synthetase
MVDWLSRQKTPVRANELRERLGIELNSFQQALFQRALAFREEHTGEVSTLDELVSRMEDANGFYWALWCESPECEARVKEETGGATIRVLDPDAEVSGSCLACARPARRRALFARAY